METTETTFENAQVGNIVWDEFRQEYGHIYLIHNSILCVGFKNNISKHYTDSGKEVGYAIRTLYWDKLILPERPKRKVKKVVEGWTNLYPTNSLYPSEELADSRALNNRLGKAHFIHHEYEVEE